MLDLEALSHDGDENVGTDRNPDLGFHCVGRGAVEGFDPEVLLDPLEEEFDLPAASVKRGDGLSREDEVVGEEYQGLAGFRVAKADAPEFRRVGLGRVPSSEDDGLVTDQACGAVDRRGIEPPEAEVPLGPDDEYGPGIVEAFEAFEINVSPVEDIDRSRLREEGVEDTNVVYAAVGDPDPSGDVAPEVQEGVQLDGPLGRPKGSPGEEVASTPNALLLASS